MSQFDQVNAELLQGSKAILDTEGEQVIYTTREGIAMSILAVIDRNPPMPEDHGGMKAPGVMAHISVSTDSLIGVTSPTIGADTVKIRKRKLDLELNQTMRIVELIDEDAGMWTLKAVL